jgi:protease III
MLMKHKTSWLVALVISTGLLAACAHKAPISKTATANLAAETVSKTVIHKSPNDDRSYAAMMLANNLQVVLVSDPTLENSAASLAVGVGSAQDPVSQQGLAHYLEHMLFLGTEKFPEPDGFMKFVAAHAGNTNAFTAFDKTNYHFQINSGKFDEALDRFSDYFKAPTLDPQYSDKERNAVNAEWSKNRDQDNWILYTLSGITANPESPRSRFSTGNLETLADKKDSKLQDEVKAFYKRYYSANNMRLTLVGKQSIAELKTLADKYFASIANRNIEIPKVTIAGLTQAQMGKSIRYQSIQDLKKIVIHFPIKDNKEQWRLKPTELVSTILGSEEEGTVCEQLRKEGLANSVAVSAHPDIYGPDGYLDINVDLTDLGVKNPDNVIASVFAYVNMVKKQGINELYFRELQAMSAKNFIAAAKTEPLQQATELTMRQFDFPVENLLNADFIYDHFDAVAVNNLLQQLDSKNARIWYVGRKEVADTAIRHFEGKYSIRDISTEERMRWDTIAKTLTFKLPPQNTLFTDKPAPIVENTFLKPHQVVSENGVEAYLAQPEFYREDKGSLDLEINVDFANKSVKNQALSGVVNDVFNNKNTTLKDRAQRASLDIDILRSATNSQAIHIAGYTTKHGELLNQLLLNYATLTINEKEFSDALERYKQYLTNNRKALAIKQAFGNLRRMVNTNHTSDSELLAAADRLTLKDAKNFHAAVKANALIRLYAFGNYSEADVKQFAIIAQKHFPSSRQPNQRNLETFIKPVAGKHVFFNNKVDQTDNSIVDAYYGDKKSDDEQALLVVLHSILNKSIFAQLRTNEQLGYIVGSTPFPIDDIPGYVLYVQSSNTDLVAVKARMDKFRVDFLQELKSVDEVQIEQFKKSEAASVLQKPTDFYTEGKRYTGDFWAAHYDFTGRDRYLASLAKINKEQLVTLYKKMFIDRKSANILVQLKGTAFASKPYAKP